MAEAIFKRCGRRDPGSKKRLEQKCPRLSERGHGSWYFRRTEAAGPARAGHPNEDGTPLDPQQAARFYVAITRAEQSVAVVLDQPGRAPYPYWTPP